MGKQERFINVHSEGSAILDDGKKQIIVDSQTGVNYLFIKSGYGAGITPLYNADGTLLVTK